MSLWVEHDHVGLEWGCGLYLVWNQTMGPFAGVEGETREHATGPLACWRAPPATKVSKDWQQMSNLVYVMGLMFQTCTALVMWDKHKGLIISKYCSFKCDLAVWPTRKAGSSPKGTHWKQELVHSRGAQCWVCVGNERNGWRGQAQNDIWNYPEPLSRKGQKIQLLNYASDHREGGWGSHFLLRCDSSSFGGPHWGTEESYGLLSPYLNNNTHLPQLSMLVEARRHLPRNSSTSNATCIEGSQEIFTKPLTKQKSKALWLYNHDQNANSLGRSGQIMSTCYSEFMYKVGSRPRLSIIISWALGKGLGRRNFANYCYSSLWIAECKHQGLG